MIRPLPLILILVVMLTSIGLGAARGTVRSGEQIVLCTGHGIVTIDLPGDQGRRTHLCPDMALSLLAAIGPADVALPLRVGHARDVRPDRGAGQGSERLGPVRVRDPPGAGFA
ncbi:hypothetical protein E4191_02560 [Paracoccus liaowanqingii]|uniref:DUF2946 domain-containing protein n=1 Tax=Paracoccus liaowanqingii TaxID=2560053 RepID=A0A4P7HI50_9RHOB|nr:hypothetical protein [Paracoccus liaowanqingii]QBX33724.1 hypothetical protein E4191_02560 [Paracoccus liaowanqingii]